MVNTEVGAQKTKSSGLLIFSGSHRRYVYIVNKILDDYPNSDLIIQRSSESFNVGGHPKNKGFSRSAINLNNRHLGMRDQIEASYYLDNQFHINDQNRILETDLGDLNSDSTVNFVNLICPKLVFVFGVGMLRQNVLDALGGTTIINLHFGLTPYYRGADTLLWPLYMQNPNHLGITLHQIDARIDHGPIYHQQQTSYGQNDSIHDIFCKTIIQAAESTRRLINLLMKGKKLTPIINPKAGKLFTRGEFTPNHLTIVYQLIKEGMIRKYLAGKLKVRELDLYSCLQ